MSLQSVAQPALYVALGATAGSEPSPSRMLRALSLAEIGSEKTLATWRLEEPNILQQKPAVALPLAGAAGGWHSLRSSFNKTVTHRANLQVATSGNLSTLAAVGNTQTL